MVDAFAVVRHRRCLTVAPPPTLQFAVLALALVGTFDLVEVLTTAVMKNWHLFDRVGTVGGPAITRSAGRAVAVVFFAGWAVGLVFVHGIAVGIASIDSRNG